MEFPYAGSAVKIFNRLSEAASKTQQLGADVPAELAIPSLLILPGDGHDFSSIYAVATAYAHSGILLNQHAAKTEQVHFTLPAMVCSSFAVELFLKFFITLDNADNTALPQGDRRGHHLKKLWDRIKPHYQDLIASMFRNPLHEPIEAGIHTRKELFLEALNHIGVQPFVDWRYAHEFEEPKHMAQGAVTQVLDAIGYAADHVMKGRMDAIERARSVPQDIIG